MKLPKLDPAWALALGFLLGPLACMINANILNLLNRRPNDDILSLGFLSMFLTGPLSFQTMRLFKIWDRDDYLKARTLGIQCGLFCLCFWFWAWYQLDNSTSWAGHKTPALFGTLLLPFAWSLLFPIFAIFKRPPKP